jgi:DNA-binding MarR family transcriptional regulator
VRLTPRGAALHRRIDDDLVRKLAWLLDRLDADDRRDLFRIIGKLTKLVEETDT